ncbi:ArsR/SmtB family transcription factor [Halosimplex halobium]|uniref:ArsR/SmtB family transcription factor n=1 Tax=Halosimplex halobium TaxID=3396618 RepID=UPI003F5750D8
MASDEADAGGVDADEAVALVGNETRLSILRCLADADGALSFSELRSRVGTADSGQFNYHLDRLTGSLVTESGEGYRLTRPGLRLVGSLLANAYAASGDEPETTAEAECPVCEGRATLSYRDSLLYVDCREAEAHRWLSDIPPGATAEHDLSELLVIGGQVNRHVGELAREGTCPQCYGETTAEIVDTRELPDFGDELGDQRYLFRAECDRCGYPIGGLVGSLVSPHPAVVSAYYDEGIDVRDQAQLPHENEQPTVLSEDPLRLRIDVESPETGERLVSLVVDGSASVVEVDESP